MLLNFSRDAIVDNGALLEGLNSGRLSRYVTETGKILPRKLTGLTARQQRHIAKAVKRARNMITMK